MINQESTAGTAREDPGPTPVHLPEIPFRPARRPRRSRTWFGWLGFPSRADAAQHLRMIGRHFLSLIGFRP